MVQPEHSAAGQTSKLVHVWQSQAFGFSGVLDLLSSWKQESSTWKSGVKLADFWTFQTIEIVDFRMTIVHLPPF
jgi:hypothetical protein